jgi:hypothetical protein
MGVKVSEKHHAQFLLLILRWYSPTKVGTYLPNYVLSQLKSQYVSSPPQQNKLTIILNSNSSTLGKILTLNQHKSMGKMIIMCVLILRFSDSQQEGSFKRIYLGKSL